MNLKFSIVFFLTLFIFAFTPVMAYDWGGPDLDLTPPIDEDPAEIAERIATETNFNEGSGLLCTAVCPSSDRTISSQGALFPIGANAELINSLDQLLGENASSVEKFRIWTGSYLNDTLSVNEETGQLEIVSKGLGCAGDQTLLKVSDFSFSSDTVELFCAEEGSNYVQFNAKNATGTFLLCNVDSDHRLYTSD